MKQLRLFIAGILMVFGICFVSAQKCSVYDKFENKQHVQSVFISKTMLEMQPNLYTKDVYIGKVAGKLDAVYILTSLDDKAKKEMRSDIEENLKRNKYEVLMKQKGMVSTSSFYVKRKGDNINELIMYTDGAAKLTFVHLFGELTTKDIQNITNYNEQSYFYHSINPDMVWNLNDIKIDISGFEKFKELNIDLSGIEKFKDIDLSVWDKLKDLHLDFEGMKIIKDLENFKFMEDNKKEEPEENTKEQLSISGLM